MPNGPRAVGIALLSALAASQAALVVLNPLLPDVARDLDVSIATAGQLRTVSGLAAGAAALATGLLAARVGLRGLMLGALAILAIGSLASGAAPDFAVLVVAQALVGVGIGVSYSAAIAATAEWSTDGEQVARARAHAARAAARLDRRHAARRDPRRDQLADRVARRSGRDGRGCDCAAPPAATRRRPRARAPGFARC